MNELDLFNKYGRSGVEPFENWLSVDLADLQTIINAELQSREQRSVSQPSEEPERCTCGTCQLLNGDSDFDN